jgi:hypothetical protein
LKIDFQLEVRAEAARLMNKPSIALLHAARRSVTTGKCFCPCEMSLAVQVARRSRRE